MFASGSFISRHMAEILVNSEVRFSGVHQRAIDACASALRDSGSVQKIKGALMRLGHRVRINVSHQTGENEEVLCSRTRRVRNRILTFLFGRFSEVLVLEPGKTICSVEIHEVEKEKA